MIEKTNVHPSEVGDIVVGTVLGPGSERAIECRMAAFYAGFPGKFLNQIKMNIPIIEWIWNENLAINTDWKRDLCGVPDFTGRGIHGWLHSMLKATILCNSAEIYD